MKPPLNAPARHYATIFTVSLAALLAEISYTRLVSFKLFYYYSYLIIGLGLLGIGAGGVLVVVSKRLRRIEIDTLLAACCTLGAVITAAGPVVVGEIPVDTRAIWTGEAVGSGVLALLGIGLAPFSAFLVIGIVISTLLSRHSQAIAGLYFVDLVGAGLACAIVVPLLGTLGPPAVIFISAALQAGTGALLWRARSRPLAGATLALAVVLLGAVSAAEHLPQMRTDRTKTIQRGVPLLFSQWSPVFRVDVTLVPFTTEEDPRRIIHHDGLWGAGLHRFDGDVSGLSSFEQDQRSIPFRVLGKPPRSMVIIGAAGGHEILASLYYGAERIEAVELNPVTVSLLTDVFADWTGRLHENPRVELVVDDGRSYLASHEDRHDVILFVAPDSYAALNAAASSAFVLTESYLYTVEMVLQSFERLAEDGIVSMHFGEFSYDGKPNRTARYVATAREALRRLGVTDYGRHILVSTTRGLMDTATVLVKRTPFSEAEIERFLAAGERVPKTRLRHAPGRALEDGPVNTILALDDDALDAWIDEYPYDVSPVTDDQPFFWHFARFSSVLAGLSERIDVIDTEDAIGERILLLLLVLAAVLAVTFLMLPFLLIRETWRALPARGASFLYFAALGLGFMLFEICLIQKLTLFLGYPTYSLTVTLAVVLVSTGLGSLASRRYRSGTATTLMLYAALAALIFLYRFGLDAVTGSLLGMPLAARVATTIGVLAPLGLVLGAFMPIGLARVSALTEHGDEYVAWAWAVNGFFSVVGSVLTTILSMTFGFSFVLLLGLAAYGAAVAALALIPATRAGR